MNDDVEISTYQMTMLLIFAYSSYLLAEVLQLTGIISVFFCGIGKFYIYINDHSL